MKRLAVFALTVVLIFAFGNDATAHQPIFPKEQKSGRWQVAFGFPESTHNGRTLGGMSYYVIEAGPSLVEITSEAELASYKSEKPIPYTKCFALNGREYLIADYSQDEVRLGIMEPNSDYDVGGLQIEIVTSEHERYAELSKALANHNWRAIIFRDPVLSLLVLIILIYLIAIILGRSRKPKNTNSEPDLVDAAT